jgi:hypothetical protein
MCRNPLVYLVYRPSFQFEGKTYPGFFVKRKIYQSQIEERKYEPLSEIWV